MKKLMIIALCVVGLYACKKEELKVAYEYCWECEHGYEVKDSNGVVILYVEVDGSAGTWCDVSLEELRKDNEIMFQSLDSVYASDDKSVRRIFYTCEKQDSIKYHPE